MVGIGHRLVAADMAQVHAAIRKHQVRVRAHSSALRWRQVPRQSTLRTATVPVSSRRFTVNSFLGVSRGLGRADMRRL